MTTTEQDEEEQLLAERDKLQQVLDTLYKAMGREVEKAWAELQTADRYLSELRRAGHSDAPEIFAFIHDVTMYLMAIQATRPRLNAVYARRRELRERRRQQNTP